MMYQKAKSNNIHPIDDLPPNIPQFNNLAFNPQVVSTIPLIVTVLITLSIAIIYHMNVYFKSYYLVKLKMLGCHRILLTFAIPLFFYCKNASMRRFVYELYCFWMSKIIKYVLSYFWSVYYEIFFIIVFLKLIVQKNDNGTISHIAKLIFMMFTQLGL